MTIEARGRANTDEIDFGAVFAVLWKRRMLIIFGTLAVTLLAATLSFFLPRTFRSEGFYQLGNPKLTIIKSKDEAEKQAEEEKKLIGVPIPFFKNSSPQFFNPNRLQLLASQEQNFTAKDLEAMRIKFASAERISRWIHPVYAYSREDVREFAQVGKDDVNSVIGLSLSYEAASPQAAQEYVRFFGNYIRDCLLYITLYDYIMDKSLTAKSELNQVENDIINTRFALLQNSKKMADIKSILTRYPESARIENRQLVSVQEGGFRYLAPVTQLVGIESTLADLRRGQSQLERDMEKLILSQEYFSRCQEALKSANELGSTLFALLKSVKVDVFKDKDFSKDTVKEVFNTLSIDLQTYDLVFFTHCRFISGPTVPLRHIRPRKSVILVVAFLLSALFFVFLAIFLSWWQGFRQAVGAERDKKGSNPGGA